MGRRINCHGSLRKLNVFQKLFFLSPILAITVTEVKIKLCFLVIMISFEMRLPTVFITQRQFMASSSNIFRQFVVPVPNAVSSHHVIMFFRGKE